MAIETLLNAIGSAFNTALKPKAKNIAEVAGPFTIDGIKDDIKVAPAVLYGSLGLKATEDTELQGMGPAYAGRFVAIVVGKHAKSSVAANREAHVLAEAVGVLLRRERWGLEYVTDAYNISIEPMATVRSKQSNLCFWRVMWWHNLALDGEKILNDWQLADFEGYDAEHYLPGADSATADPVMESQKTY